jgi:hypothetical protein
MSNLNNNANKANRKALAFYKKVKETVKCTRKANIQQQYDSKRAEINCASSGMNYKANS